MSKNGKSASVGIASTSGGIARPSGGIASTSGGIAGPGGVASTSGGPDIASGSSGVALANSVRNIKHQTRKLFHDGGPLDPEILYSEHLDGMKNDFAHLLNVPRDHNSFQFKWEKNWENEANSRRFGCERFFNLNMDLLSQGLDCLPYYEKIGIDKSALPELDIERCDRQASKASDKYAEFLENYKIELREKMKLSQSFEDLTGIKWEPRKPKVVEPEEVEEPMQEMDPSTSRRGRFWLSHRTELKEKGDDGYLVGSSSSDESLEIWLDTYLDE